MSISPEDLMIVLSYGSEAEISDMVKKAKIKFVNEHHHRSITQLTKGAKAGRWKTYVGTGATTKEVQRATKEELYDWLYAYYSEQQTTFACVFEMLMVYKLTALNRKPKTIEDDRCNYHRFIPSSFSAKRIDTINKDDVATLIRNAVITLRPTPEALKRMKQIISQTFDYALDHDLCTSNPAARIDLSCYYKDCNLTRKADEDKAFSDRELELLSGYAYKRSTNPHALMMLLSAETGMRSAELAALKWEDIEDNYIHIHRQQLYENGLDGGTRRITYVDYNKNERIFPDDGRRFPITPKITAILKMARLLGPGEMVFHDKGKREVSKDSYEQYLARACTALGISTTNNHAYRMALNSRLIAMGLPSTDRALLLGHDAATNERFYTLTDRRRLDNISQIMHQYAPEAGADDCEHRGADNSAIA